MDPGFGQELEDMRALGQKTPALTRYQEPLACTFELGIRGVGDSRSRERIVHHRLQHLTPQLWP